MLARAFTNADWKWTFIAGASVVASPLIWNIVARNEKKNRTLTNLFGNSPKKGCYALATWIFLSSLVRDKLIEIAIQKSKPAEIPYLGESAAAGGLGLTESLLKKLGISLTATGMVFVCSAYYRLGITGTYLGDYFGILMSERVTAFPFNLLNDPMYTGATLGFLGLAVHENSPVGLLLSAWLWLVYEVSTTYFEGPYTAQIYADKARREAKTQ